MLGVVCFIYQQTTLKSLGFVNYDLKRVTAEAHGEACVHADPVKRFIRCFSNVICKLWLKFLYLNIFHYFVMFVICSENWESICNCRCSD